MELKIPQNSMINEKNTRHKKYFVFKIFNFSFYPLKKNLGHR